MHNIPKKQAQNLLVDPLATILKDTYPNLRQATFQGFIRRTISISNKTYPRGTDWQEQLFRLSKLASEKLEG